MTVIKDAIAIVTGASGGIGAAVCESLGSQGATLLLAGRDENSLETVRTKLSLQGIKSVVQPTDVTSRSQVRTLIERAMRDFGRIDILVNNAAIGLFQTVADSTEEDISLVLATNFWGPLNCIQEALPVMREQKHGHIVNISSIIGRHSVYHQGIYAASKAALDRLSESVQAEELLNGIRVTVLVPDRTDTSFIQHALGPRELAILPGRNLRKLDAAYVAAGLVRAIEKDEFVHYSSLKGRIFAILSCTFPAVIRYILRQSHE